MPSLPTRLRARPSADAPTRVGSDRGDIILSWLTKISLLLAVAGVVLFDAISVGTTAISLTDQGQQAAREASETWQRTDSVQKAYEAAAASAAEQDPENVVDPASFHIDEDNTVHLTVSRTAASILLYRWGRTAKWANLDREAKGQSIG
jgi:hypothetical protein